MRKPIAEILPQEEDITIRLGEENARQKERRRAKRDTDLCRRRERCNPLLLGDWN